MDNQNIHSFFSDVNSKVEFVNSVKKEFSKTLASDFNSLNFWNINENKVSEIFTFFLNISEDHGQGDLYLNLFLKKFKLSFPLESGDKIETVVEKRTHNNRRLDIFISNEKGTHAIGIENKLYVWTDDQHKQVDDYIDFLNQKSKNNQFTLLYLAPKNKQICTNSFDKQTFEENFHTDCLKFISYEEDLVPLIHEFAIHTENERVRSFLLDFERKIKTLFMGNSDINEQSIIKECIVENLETSLMIFNNFPVVKNELRAKFYDQMIEISNELKIHIDDTNTRFYLDKLGNNKIAVNFEGGGLIYGVIRNAEDLLKTTYADIEFLFVENFEVSYWWSMWRWMYRDIEYSPEFWQGVLDGSVKKLVKDFIETIIDSKININH